MKNDYIRPNERLIFTQSKHDRTDRAFLVGIGCLAFIEGIAQLVKLAS
jgi:hypothetical protein